MEIRKINVEDTLSLRSSVLRNNIPLEECRYPTDKVAGCFHLGAYIEDELVGIATFFPERLLGMSGEKHYRLRGMAVKDSFKKQGIGTKLVEHAMHTLKKSSASVVWYNARELAFGYYEKLGFKYFGGMFEIEGIGPHKKMYYLMK